MRVKIQDNLNLFQMGLYYRVENNLKVSILILKIVFKPH